jgi:hypothetical protein
VSWLNDDRWREEDETGGEEGGTYYRRLQEVDPYHGGNVNRSLKVRPEPEFLNI